MCPRDVHTLPTSPHISPGHEGSGSLFDVIKNKGWATSLSAGMRYNMPDFSLFSVTIDLTVDGLKNTNEIVRLLYQYIALMHGMEEGQWKWTFEEMLALDEMSFRFKSKESPSHFSSSLAQTLHDYPPEHLLNSRYHYPDFDVEKIKSLLSYVSADNCFFTVISKDFEGKTESTEPWYQTQYTVRDMDSELKAIMQNPGPTDLLQLPAENQYIATNFDLITGASATASVDAAVAASDASAASDADIDVDASICTDGKSADADADTNVDVKTARMKKWSKKWKLDDRDMTHPIKIKDDKQMIAFYKPDVTYKKPKLYAYGALVSPSAKGSPETQVASFLLARLVRNKLSSGVYDASLAGLHFVLSGTDEGMKFYFSGYNEKLHVLVEDVFSAIATYHIDTEAYAVEKEKLVRELMSFDKEQPYNHAEVAHDLLLVHKTYHKKVLLSALQSMSAEDFDKLYKELFTACYIRLMVYGNCNEESAHKLANSAYNIIYSPNTDASSSSSSFAEADRVISPRPLYPHEFPESRCIELPEGVNHYYRLTHPSADEKNACLKSTFQIGPDTTETRCMLLLLTHMMREPCFNVLRTKEQLGYLVWSGINVFEGVLSAHITVQSSVRQAGYLDDRAEAFLQYFGNEYLKKEVDEETFLDNIEATIDNRTERPKTMGSQMNRYMKELNRRRFEWTQLSEEVECLKSIKLVDVQAFFDHHFGFNSPHRRKLALQIFAQKSGGDDETKDGDETKNAKEAVTGDAAATDGESGKEGETEKLLPVPVAAADSPVTTTVIEDYVSFQRANPTYPNYWEKVTAKL